MWAAEFRRKESLEDDTMSGGPATVSTEEEENIVRVHPIVMKYGRITMNQIINAISISRETFKNIRQN